MSAFEIPTKEQNFEIEFVFKPIEPGQILREEERQLLLAYMGEILKEIEAEEKSIIAEEKLAQENGSKCHDE